MAKKSSKIWDGVYGVDYGLVYVSGLPIWIGNYMNSEVRGEMTYPFQKFNGFNQFQPTRYMDVITYPCWDYR